MADAQHRRLGRRHVAADDALDRDDELAGNEGRISVPSVGHRAWPPVPLNLTCQLSDAASIGPERMAKRPAGCPACCAYHRRCRS